MNFHYALFNIGTYHNVGYGGYKPDCAVRVLYVINVVCTRKGHLAELSVLRTAVIVNNGETYQVLNEIGALVELHVVSVHIEYFVPDVLRLFGSIYPRNFHDNDIFLYPRLGYLHRLRALVKVESVKLAEELSRIAPWFYPNLTFETLYGDYFSYFKVLLHLTIPP